MNLPSPTPTERTNTLALQFRPRVWAEVRGQEVPVAVLSNSLKLGDIKPAYLLSGLTGSGKTTCSYIFAKALLCEALTPTQDPCMTCESCLAVDRGTHGDLMVVDGAADRGIDFVKNRIKPFLSQAPIRGKRKVVIIDEVHKYSSDAISAFLTMFENMPAQHGKSVAILCTTETHKVLETVRNRCLCLNFAPIDADQIAEVLVNTLGVDFAPARLLAEESNGSFRTVWSHIETWEKLQADFTEETVMMLLNGVSWEERQKLWAALAAGKLDAVAKLWKTWTGKGVIPWVVARSLVRDLGRYAMKNPKASGWREALAILSGAQVSSPESAWPESLYMLSGLPLDVHNADRQEPEERQPTPLTPAPSSDSAVNPLLAQRILFFGA